MSEENEQLPASVVKGFDRLLTVQRPLVLANIRAIRRRKPNATPEEVIRILERHYLSAVTSGGAAVGASAAVPGIGTAASLALSGAETAGFLEASALFAQSVTEVHGITVVEPERARSLVMALMLGGTGRDLVKQFAGQMNRGGITRTAYWGELVTNNLPKAMMGQLTDRLKKKFLHSFLTRQSGSVLGRLVPFGIGAVIGGSGNHLLGRRVINSAREAFPPAPLVFHPELDPRVKPSAETAEAERRFRLPGSRRKARKADLPQLEAADDAELQQTP